MSSSHDTARKRVAVVGAGPAGLFAAETLAGRGVEVTLFDRMPTVGRKFLMAGRGGLNLTHSEALEAFLPRYGAARERLAPMLAAFPPRALIAWAEGLGQTTFVGSSGRVFPKAMKASPLLRAWLRRLDALGVRLRSGWTWRGWDDQGRLCFEDHDPVEADVTVLALGGASWPRLGSDGGWVDLLAARGVPTTPLRPANCGFVVPWSPMFGDRFAGAPLKPVTVSFGDRQLRGELMITRKGLEGGAIYALSAPLRDAIARDGHAALTIDLRPDVDEATLAARLDRPRNGRSFSEFLRKTAGLGPGAINLLREVNGGAQPADLVAAIKRLRLTLSATAGLERAISTAGGVAWSGVNADLSLKALPGVFVAGEMLDWEAPTGGYLLQACFASGAWAAAAAAAVLDSRK